MANEDNYDEHGMRKSPKVGFDEVVVTVVNIEDYNAVCDKYFALRSKVNEALDYYFRFDAGSRIKAKELFEELREMLNS